MSKVHPEHPSIDYSFGIKTPKTITDSNTVTISYKAYKDRPRMETEYLEGTAIRDLVDTLAFILKRTQFADSKFWQAKLIEHKRLTNDSGPDKYTATVRVSKK